MFSESGKLGLKVMADWVAWEAVLFLHCGTSIGCSREGKNAMLSCGRMQKRRSGLPSLRKVESCS